MIREVNLISHLPSYIQSYREIQGIMNAEEPELQLIEDDSETIKDNMFILYTDEEGIKRYEKMLGLLPLKGDNLYNRQAKVLAQYTNTVIYTLRGLKERLDVICGVDNYTIKFIPNEYKIDINLHLNIKNLVNTITLMIKNMIPANMICTCNVNYNTHKMFTNYPIYLLMQFTHYELYSEVIENNISVTCDNIANYTTESVEAISCENLSTYGMRKV